MKRILTIGKMFILVLLIGSSIVQISKLWFGGNSNRNFFYSVIPTRSILSSTRVRDISSIVEPDQLSVYIAEKELYTVIRKGANVYEAINDALIEVVKSTLYEGAYMGEVDDSSMLWDRPHYMIRLPLAYDNTLFEENLDLKKNSLNTFDQTQRLIIVPSEQNTGNDYIDVYIEDYDKKVYEHYRSDVDDSSYHNAYLSNYMVGLEDSSKLTTYISTLKNGIGYYEEHVLLPQPSGNIRYHDKLYMTIPFVDGSDVDIETMTNYVKHFFKNPELISVTELEEVYLFMAPDMRVRVEKNGLVHYKRTEITKPEFVDVSIALKAANDFIEKDNSTIETAAESYLRDYDIEEDIITFYYDMGFNDFPIVVSEKVNEVYKLDNVYPVAISVSGDEVIEYKRILRSIDEAVPQDSILESKYQSAVDQFVETRHSDTELIKDMYLGYEWSDFETALTFKWIIETSDDKFYFSDVD